MPVVSILLPFDSGYKSWKLTVWGKDIPFGVFFGDIITFLIISLFLFILIKKLLYCVFEQEKEEEITLQEKTLLEIKDILSQRP